MWISGKFGVMLSLIVCFFSVCLVLCIVFVIVLVRLVGFSCSCSVFVLICVMLSRLLMNWLSCVVLFLIVVISLGVMLWCSFVVVVIIDVSGVCRLWLIDDSNVWCNWLCLCIVLMLCILIFSCVCLSINDVWLIRFISSGSWFDCIGLLFVLCVSLSIVSVCLFDCSGWKNYFDVVSVFDFCFVGVLVL